MVTFGALGIGVFAVLASLAIVFGGLEIAHHYLKNNQKVEDLKIKTLISSLKAAKNKLDSIQWLGWLDLKIYGAKEKVEELFDKLGLNKNKKGTSFSWKTLY